MIYQMLVQACHTNIDIGISKRVSYEDMNPIKEARVRAGLTQKVLAERLGTHQPVVARWENGRTRPDFDTVVRVVEACGFEFHFEMRPVEHDTVLVRRELAKPPAQRLEGLVEAVTAFDAMVASGHG